MSAVLAVAALGLTGCSRSISLSDPTPAPTAVAVCDRLVAALPEVTLNADRRRVQPGRFTAAWGDPPIILRCGVPKPPALGGTSRCFEVNGVGWFAEPASGGYLFTTIGRTVYVEVGVPSAYAPEANALADLAAAVRDTVPVQRPCV